MVLLQRRHLSAQRSAASQCCVIEQNGQKWAHARRACNCCLLGSSLECAAHDRRFSTCSTVRHQAGIHKACAHYYSTLAQTMPQQQHGETDVLSSPLLVQDWCASGYSFHLLGSTRQSAADVGEHTKGQPSRPRVKTSYVVHK